MSILQLHEDTAIAPYTQFDVVEIDMSKLAQLGASITNLSYTQGVSAGHRIHVYLKNNSIYQALSTNCPRSALDKASIIKNKNNWVVKEGIYQRENTVMTPVSVQPSDFTTSIHYYSREIWSNVMVYSPRWTYSYWGDYQFYKDESEKDQRCNRLFYTDAGLSFTVNSCATTNPRFQNHMYKYTNFGGFFGCAFDGYGLLDPPYYYTYNGRRYNPWTDSEYQTDSVRAMIGTVWNSYYMDLNPAYNEGVESVKQEKNDCVFFGHAKYNNIDYYGLVYIKLSDDTELAYPTIIQFLLFEDTYFGTSIIPGGTIPTGNWGPQSSQSGGGGSWDNTDDSATIQTPLPIASLPNALTVGGLHAYLMSESMLDKLSGLMYNPTTFNNFWSKWLNQKFNPISGIISIHKVPFALQPTGAETFVKIAGATLDATYMSDLGACLGDLISVQYTETPEYTLSLPEYFGSFYDYEPYTKCYLHLPACGIVKISANEIIGGSISVTYRCDILTGNVGAIVKTTDRNSVVKTQYYTGNCAYKLPFIGRDDGGVDNIISLVSGGISALTGNIAGVIGAGKSIAEREHSTTMTGDCTGNSAPLSDLKLWLEVVRVVPSTPEKKQEMQGIPANVYMLLYTLSDTGYAEIESVHLENIDGATENELAELESILKNGVIF